VLCVAPVSINVCFPHLLYEFLEFPLGKCCISSFSLCFPEAISQDSIPDLQSLLCNLERGGMFTNPPSYPQMTNVSYIKWCNICIESAHILLYNLNHF
jgi:hypothetical protein